MYPGKAIKIPCFPFFVKQIALKSQKWQNIVRGGRIIMKNNDKIIAAFLVSVGIFSAAQATQYLGTLSMKEKTALFSVAKGSNNNLMVCESPVFEVGEPRPKKA